MDTLVQTPGKPIDFRPFIGCYFTIFTPFICIPYAPPWRSVFPVTFSKRKKQDERLAFRGGFRLCLWLFWFFVRLRIPRDPITLRQMMIGVYNHLLSQVFRFHYHSQKVIGSLGNDDFMHRCDVFVSRKKMWVFHGYMFVYQRVGGETSKIFMFTTKIGERM